mmetsp:Transcript_16919/g.33027  ORF Transcript_16919/g.33027 Transcript_16919/m.33027 type:complete len:129 (-) Transcript_16919:821-1207(-)
MQLQNIETSAAAAAAMMVNQGRYFKSVAPITFSARLDCTALAGLKPSSMRLTMRVSQPKPFLNSQPEVLNSSNLNSISSSPGLLYFISFGSSCSRSPILEFIHLKCHIPQTTLHATITSTTGQCHHHD